MCLDGCDLYSFIDASNGPLSYMVVLENEFEMPSIMLEDAQMTYYKIQVRYRKLHLLEKLPIDLKIR